jgi:hypothetical protein
LVETVQNEDPSDDKLGTSLLDPLAAAVRVPPGTTLASNLVSFDPLVGSTVAFSGTCTSFAVALPDEEDSLTYSPDSVGTVLVVPSDSPNTGLLGTELLGDTDSLPSATNDAASPTDVVVSPFGMLVQLFFMT